MKYLAPLTPNAQPPPLDNSCVFQNMKLAAWHVQFLNAFDDWVALDFEGYLDLVMRRESRTMWGGSVRYRPNAPHPVTGQTGVISFSVYAEDSAGNKLRVGDVVEAHQAIIHCTSIDDGRIVFLAEGRAQRRLAIEASAELIAAGIVAIDRASLAGDTVTPANEEPIVCDERIGGLLPDNNFVRFLR